MLAGAAGAAGATLRQVAAAKSIDNDPSYTAAYRLLAQLRPVARQLAVGLDTVTIAEGLLQSLHEIEPFERGAVLVRTGSSRLSPLAVVGERIATVGRRGGRGDAVRRSVALAAAATSRHPAQRSARRGCRAAR